MSNFTTGRRALLWKAADWLKHAFAATVLTLACAAPALAGPQQDGTWGPVLQWPHIPVSAANLPDGRILTWSSNERNAFPWGTDFTYTAVWNPQTGQFQEISRDGHDMFCGHLVMLEDGRIVVNGGNDSSNGKPQVSIFDYRNDQWNFTFPLQRARWYPTTVAMPDGSVFTALGAGGGSFPEVWKEDTGWELKSGINLDQPILSYNLGEREWWPLLHVAPDGRIFQSGPTPRMHYIDTAGAGSITSAGPLVDAWYHKHGTTVMYDEGKILTAGGWKKDNATSSNKAMVIDINGPAPIVREIQPMAFARKFQNGVIFPNGEVLVVGGNTSGEKFSDSGTIYQTEIFNPDTETWRTAASISVPRNYHSVALLMTDGRVFSGGGGLCDCPPDHQDAQIYTPGYLYNADGSLATRPQITDAPALIGNGQVFRVSATPGLARFTMIKMSSTTHAVNTDLRFLEFAFTEVSGGQYDLTAHANVNVLTPGYWMLFGLDGAGVPSVSKVLQVSTSNAPLLDDPGPQTTERGKAVSLQMAASDPNNDPLTFSATGLPPGLQINSATGLISGTPTTDGNYGATVTVSDGTGSDTVGFAWYIVAPGSGGQITEVFSDFSDVSRIRLNSVATTESGVLQVTPNVQMSVGTAFLDREFGLTANSSFSTRFQFRISGGAETGGDGMSFIVQSGGPNAYSDSGVGSGVGHGGLANSLAIEIDTWSGGNDSAPDNHVAVMTGGDITNHIATATPGYDFHDGKSRTMWVDYDGVSNQLEVFLADAATTQKPATPILSTAIDLPSVVGETAWFGFGAGTGYFYGIHAIENWQLTIPGSGGEPPQNTPPVIANPGAQTNEIDVAVNLQISASDADGDSLTYSATGLPTGLSINGNTGLISGTPVVEETKSVTVSVADGKGGTDSETFTWTIQSTAPANNPPVITNPGAQATIAGTPVSLQITASDPDGDTLTYSALNLPPGLTMNQDTGLVSGTPTTTGTYVSVVVASDGQASPSAQFNWTITDPGSGGGTVTETFSDFTDASKLMMNGAAIAQAGVLEVTPNAQFLSGTAFLDREVDWSGTSAFSTRFQFKIAGGEGGPGGDGMTFIIQGNGPDAYDDAGMGSGVGYANIGNSVAVELDTFQGSNNDPSENHIAILSNGDVSNHIASYTTPFQLKDGASRTLWIDYDGTTDKLDVYVANAATTQKPASPVISATLDLGALIGPSAWFGFGAGTGYFFDGHGIENWTITIPGSGGQQNTPPIIAAIADQSTEVSTEVSLQISASDSDGDPLTYSATGLPPGLTIGQTTGRIVGNPTTAGDYTPTVSVADGQGGTASRGFAWTITDTSGGGPTNSPPQVSNPGPQISTVGQAVSLQISASDPDTDPLTYAAAGLPAGLAINATTGLITGTPTTQAGATSVTVTVSDGQGGQTPVSFNWTVNPPAAVTVEKIVSPPKPVNTAIAYTAVATGEGALSYAWTFGDGTGTTQTSEATISHTYTQPGRYVASVTVTDSANQSASRTFMQAVHEPLTAGKPAASSNLLYHSAAAGNTVWSVNPDNDTVSVFNASTGAKLAETAVGDEPHALARISESRVWVTNQASSTISVIDAGTRAVLQTIALPRGGAPYGIVASPDGATAYVALEELGKIFVYNTSSYAKTGEVDVGPFPRHLSITGDGARVYVSRFITPPLPGEATAAPIVSQGGTLYGGEVVAVDTTSLSAGPIIVLQHSDRIDSEHTGRGIPNYLGPAVISPDGLSAYVPSKQDNIMRGQARDGSVLTHDLTVRAVSSKIMLATETEDFVGRVDHDNSSMASAATYGAYGNYMFVALEGNRQIAVIDPYGEEELFRFDVDRAPQGVAVSPDGLTLYVHNFMSRTISVHDISAVINEDQISVTRTGTWASVATEALGAQLLKGKQFFYDARDTRLANETYMSCASCHNAGGQDGRVWDFTQFGEGLRNTITLKGHGQGMGNLHWSANFDEIHDFEGQIRNFAGGTGLMTDAQFNTGTRSDPLGDPKAGVSADLDALAAYVSSLVHKGVSPYRAADGSLTPDGLAGRDVFTLTGCADCHNSAQFTDSASGGAHDVGTLKSTSGPMTAVDTPTLAGLWNTGPYLHDGSAPTLAAAVTSHSGVGLSGGQVDQIVTFLNQIDDSEPAPSAGGSGGTTFTFADFSDVTQLQLNGVATSAQGVLQVTPDAAEMSSGSAYLAQSHTITPSTSFSTRFTFRIHGGRPNSPPGDGMAFLIQGVGPGALGGVGSGIGYGGIANSVVVELDTWGGNDQNDPSDNHVAVMQNGVTSEHLASYSPAFVLADGGARTLWIDYDASSQMLSIYIAQGATSAKPATAVLSASINLAGTVGSTGYFGFSAGTGYFYNSHDIESWTLELSE